VTRRFALAAAALISLAACRDARQDARTELERLGGLMTTHAARFGRYPETIDAARPASASNLPFKAEHGVDLRLLQSSREAYQAVAVRKSWTCFMIVGAGNQGRMECAPVGNGSRAAAAASGSPLEPLPGVLHSPAVTRADSDSAAATAPCGTRRRVATKGRRSRLRRPFAHHPPMSDSRERLASSPLGGQ
jgi:hypothetical protein